MVYTETRLRNDRAQTALYVRPGGAGNAWKLLDTNGMMNNPSGGGQGVESIWGTGESGNSEALGTRFTGNPDRITAQVMMPLTAEKFLTQLRDLNCIFDLSWRSRCGDIRDRNDYKESIDLLDSAATSRGYDVNLRQNDTGENQDIKNQVDTSALTDERLVKLIHLDISGQVSDVAINKVIAVSVPRCAGRCGDVITGEEEFYCVTDRDSTSGYVGNPTAKFGYTTNSGEDWTEVYINVFQAADAKDVVKVGSKVLVVGSKGVAYASIEDIKNGVSAPFSLATGVTSGNCIAVAPNGTIWVGADSGVVYRSTDGGYSFETFDNGLVTAQNINDIAVASDNLIWFGANSGVLLKYQNGSLVNVTVKTAITGGTTLSANINTVQVPPLRGNQLYIGTAGGQIWRSKDSTTQIPLFSILSFDKTGEGSIDDLEFVGYRGTTLFVLQSNANGYSRVLRDRSGGNMGNDVEIVGSFTSPGNFNINSIAPANSNFAITVGEVHETYSVIGKVTGVAA